MIKKPKNRRIAVARITGLPDRRGCYPVSLGGDGLASLEPPFLAELYRPDYFGTDLKQILRTARQGPREDGLFYPVEIRAASFQSSLRGKKARVFLSLTKEVQREIRQSAPAGESQSAASDLETGRLDLSGFWICVRSSQLSQAIKDDEYFVYEILGLPVFTKKAQWPATGEVTDFLETGAHGVIEITLATTQEVVLIPMIQEYVSFVEDRTALLIPRLEEFLDL